MYTITIWNKKSTNFDSNEFVRKNGTERINIESRAQAAYTMIELIGNEAIHKAILSGHSGRLIWERPLADDQEISQHYGNGCNCSKCRDCDDDECDEDDYGCPREDDDDYSDDDSINFPESF